MTRHQYGISALFFSDVISLGNQWWRREMWSVFSVLDSGFHTVYSGFEILDSRFLQLSATWKVSMGLTDRRKTAKKLVDSLKN